MLNNMAVNYYREIPFKMDVMDYLNSINITFATA